MMAYGYQLSSDEIYTIQINQQDLKTLLGRVPTFRWIFCGGVISHFLFSKWPGLLRGGNRGLPGSTSRGDIIWSKKIGYREVRIPFTSETFSSQSQEILNSLLEKTLQIYSGIQILDCKLKAKKIGSGRFPVPNL